MHPFVGAVLLGTGGQDPLVLNAQPQPRDLGYVEGRNIVIEYRAFEGRAERFPEIIAEFVRLTYTPKHLAEKKAGDRPLRRPVFMPL